MAILDSLRFGELDDGHQRHLFSRRRRRCWPLRQLRRRRQRRRRGRSSSAVRANCLVNAMCVGVLPAERLHLGQGRRRRATWSSSTAPAPAATGSAAPACWPRRDSTRARPPSGPSVQIGDPFMGKKLIECTLELLDAGLLASLQDLGAAGLASSTSEMAASGGVGLDIDLSRGAAARSGHGAVRDHDLASRRSGWRRSSSPTQLDAVLEACARWEVDATRDRQVTGSGVLRAFHDGDEVGDIPVATLVDGRAALRGGAASGPPGCATQPLDASDRAADPRPCCARFCSSPNIASRRWITRQYDQLVGSGTVVRPGGDAGVVRLTPSDRAIAICLDGNGRRTSLDPRRGGDERGVRGGPQRRLHRCAAGGGDQLPELRQPRDPRGRLRAGRGDRGHGAGLRGARHCRWSRATSRSTTSTWDARSIRRRWSAWSGVLEDAELAVHRRLPRRRATSCSWRATAPRRSTAPSTRRSCCGRVEGRIPEPDLAHRARACTSSWPRPPRRDCCERPRRLRRRPGDLRSPSRRSPAASA